MHFMIICTGFLPYISLKSLKSLKSPKSMNVRCNSLNNNCECKEQMIYRQYLIGLRKSRRLLNNASNINTLLSIANFTNQFINTYTTISNTTSFNNSEIGAKNIMMGNMVLDVSNVKYIKISTEKDTIIIELDKQQQKTDLNLLERINNVETIINTVSLLGKIINLN